MKPVQEMVWNFLLYSGLLHDRNNRDYDYTFQRQVMRGIVLCTNLHEVSFAQPFGPLLMYLKHMGAYG